MKKLFISLIACFFLALGISLADDYDAIKDYSSYNEQLYICGLNTCFPNYQARLDYFSIDQDIIDNCSTVELLELMLSCPMAYNLYVYNSMEEGVEGLIRDFSYYEEFINRTDAISVALAAYRNYYIPEYTRVNYDILIHDSTRIDDFNTLASDSSYYRDVYRDAMIVCGVDLLENLILYMAKDERLTANELEDLSESIDLMKNKEENSKYYNYGDSKSYFVKNKHDVIGKMSNTESGFAEKFVETLRTVFNFYVYTPSGTAVNTTYDTKQTPNGTYVSLVTASSHHMTLYAESYQECNCHSFAWLSNTTSYSGNYTHIWLENVSAFRDDSYYTCSSVPTVGAIANHYSDHSEIVFQLNAFNEQIQGPETLVISKWGHMAIFKHFNSGTTYEYNYDYYTV